MRTWENAEPPLKGEAGPGQRQGKTAFLLLLLIPLDCVITAAVMCTELLGRLCRRFAPRKPPQFRPPRPECSFVIVAWNSQSLLAESLPPLLQAIRQQGGKHEVIVLDNHSTDGTDEYIQRRFPEVRLVRTPANLYFGAGNRAGVQAATRDIVVMMNSDTVVRPGFLEPLLQALEDPAVFGVSSQVCGIDGETGYTQGELHTSHIEWRHDSVPQLKRPQTCPVLWLHRAMFAVDRRKYLWLGGLDSLYDPVFFEDVDLSYRAWKAGWTCLLVPDSRVDHHHSLSVPDAGKSFLHILARRNQYIFSWKNLNDLRLIAGQGLHASGIRIRRARIPAIGMGREIRSFLGAIERLPRVLARRLAMSRSVTCADRQVFSMAEQLDAAVLGGIAPGDAIAKAPARLAGDPS